MTHAATILFGLWGLIHIAGGLTMLATAGDPAAYLQTIATGDPAAGALLPPAGSAAMAVFAFHAWNIAWAGICVTVIAVVLNRRNSVAGYWINLALVSGADIGLLVFLVLPGIMGWATASPGLGLWIPGAITGFLALSRSAAGPHAG